MEYLDKPWPKVTKALRKAKKRVAVTPYLNGDVYTMLPLRSDKDMLVVNACELNVKRGLTNPHVIEKFLEARVKCWTVNDLHAKVYRADNELFVGSNNGSSHSRDTLLEACLQVRNSQVVEQFEVWVGELPLVPLTKERVAALKKLYKPPRWGNARRSAPRLASAWTIWVKGNDDSDETQEYIDDVSKSYDLDCGDIFTIRVAKSNRLVKVAKPGDEFFVLDHNYKRIRAYAPMRLIERPKLIGDRYRFALQDNGETPASFSAFLKRVRKSYPGFSDSGKTQRSLSPAAAAELRRLWQ